MPTTVHRTYRFRKTLSVAAAAAAAAGTGTMVFSAQYASADEPLPAAEPGCVMETLPIPDGLVHTVVSGMSDDGSVIAYYAEPLSRNFPDGLGAYPRLYMDGQVIEVDMPGDHPQIKDVNSSGAGAGYTNLDGDHVPYVWRDGELTELPRERDGQAWGINEAADIVGNLDWQPVIWPAGGSEAIHLPLPDGAISGNAYDIGDDGTVVGTVYNDNGTASATIWQVDDSGTPVGAGAALPLPEGSDPDNSFGIATDLNGEWATGMFFTPGAGTLAQGIRWDIAEGTAEMTSLARSEGVSADGTVVSHLAGTSTAAYQAGDTVVELPGVMEPGNRPYDEAVEISADGTVIAGFVYIGRDDEDRVVYNAVTWTCQ